MLRISTYVLIASAAITGLLFVALVLGGYPGVLEHERAALAPLILGLAASVLQAYRGSYISRTWTRTFLVLLVIWVIYLFPRIGGQP
jgi:hypothetical protein